MNDQYQDPIFQKYIALIKANNDTFKSFYLGDPVRIPSSSLPAVVFSKISTQVANLTNVEDEHQIRFSITVITDIRNEISDEKTMVPGVNALYNLMEGREADYTLKKNSLLYILRHNVELDVGNQLRTDLKTMTNIDYGMTLGKRQPDEWSIEGVLTLQAHFTQVR